MAYKNDATNGELIKIKAYYAFCLFPKLPAKLGESPNNYGITKWEIVEVLEGEPILDRDQRVTITGEFYEPPEYGKIYTILAKKIEHPRYGVQYNLLYLNFQLDFSKLSHQKAFLRTFLSEGQIAEMYKIYANPLAIIDAHDIEGLKKVKGIGDYIARCILERYDNNKDLSRVYVELDEYGFTPNFIQRLTRTYKDPLRLIKTVKENPYQLIDDVDGIGFKTADDIALKGGLNPKSVERIQAFISYFLKEEAYTSGNSYITAGELLTNVYDYFGGKEYIAEEICDEEGNVTGTNIGEAIKRLQEKDVVRVEDGENKSRRRIYLTKIWKLEKEIAFHLRRLLKAKNKMQYDDWKERVAELERRQGFAFAEEQLNGIKLGLDEQVCLISGLAGSGKSSLVSGILAALKNYSFAQCALSGKAAARLQEVTGAQGCTIHRLLSYSPAGFTYNEDNPLAYDIIILDEVSLVGGEIFLSLIKAIPDGSKLIMLGDMGQLESIGALNLAADIYDSPIIPTVELKQVHRQAAQSGIITSAHAVRNQEQLYPAGINGVDIRGELQDMIFDIDNDRTKNREKVFDWFKQWYDSDIVQQDIMKIQLISPVKERGDCCVHNLNLDVQSYLNPLKEGETCIYVDRGEKSYSIHVNDKVMCIKNNYNTTDQIGMTCPIYNGWVGIVKEINDFAVAIDFPLAGGIVYVPQSDVRNEIVLGYASTVHKLQGSDAPVVIGALDYSTPPKMLTCQLLYTLLTRAKKRCIVVAELGALSKAISTDFVSTKRTFLKELLETEDLTPEQILEMVCDEL